MSEAQNPNQDSAKAAQQGNPNEIALEMMKFIAVQTGYGKSGSPQAGFGAKGTSSPEQYAEALLQLFEKCREVVKKD